MQVKLLEIRDEGTMIPIIAIDMNPNTLIDDMLQDTAQRYLLRRVGYPCDGRPNIAITALGANGGMCWNDPYGWGGRTYRGRTYPIAHNYIIQRWHDLKDGDVVDVEYIMGETKEPKKSERLTSAVDAAAGERLNNA